MRPQRRRVRHPEFADMVAEVKVVDLRDRVLRTSRRLATYRLASFVGFLSVAVAVLLLLKATWPA